MQIIQSIRDKGAAIVIVVIALSLIGFILMDARQGSSNLFNSLSSNVGKVNGEGIELGEFNKRVKQAEDMQAQRGQSPAGTQTYQIREQTWNQIVAERIFFSEAEKLGIDFTSKELSYILLSDEQNNPLLQEQGMRDSATGKLDIEKAKSALTNIKKFKGEQREAIDVQLIEPLKLSTTVAKYTGLLNASVYYPAWMQEKETAEAKNFAVISYTAIPYSEISDSTVTVTDAEIKEYVQENKDLFKQEEGRNISYVAFSQLPNNEDSVRTKTLLSELKDAFASDTNSTIFLSRNSSATEFQDEFLPLSKIESVAKDTIVKMPVGTVYGPYVDKGNYVVAKILGSKELPDSVKARHILIPVNDSKTGEPIRPDTVAKKLADSLFNAIKGGADFATLALQFSSDGSKDKGGDLGTYSYGTMVPEFNKFTFTNPIGSKDVVKTQFGYHVIEIMNQKDFKPSYKIAYLAKEITPSDATINKASLDATKASAEKDGAALKKYAAKNGLQFTEVPALIKENDFTVGNLQDARSLVRWVFEAKKGNVSEPFSIGDQFVVAVLEKINAKGVQDPTAARAGSESLIRNKKKAAIIQKKIGNNPTLESAATAYNKQVQQAGMDSSITFTSQIINGVGVESKIIGASFNKDYQAKPSPPIVGTGGVYLLKVNLIQAKPADTPEANAQQATTRKNALRSQVNSWYEGLKKLADIEDKRSKHY